MSGGAGQAVAGSPLDQPSAQNPCASAALRPENLTLTLTTPSVVPRYLRPHQLIGVLSQEVTQEPQAEAMQRQQQRQHHGTLVRAQHVADQRRVAQLQLEVQGGR